MTTNETLARSIGIPIDDLAEHMRAVEARGNELITEATTLQAATFRRLEAAGISRATVDALARSLGSPPLSIPFSTILAALADHFTKAGEVARSLAAEWQAWDTRLADLEAEGEARALALEGEGGRPC